MWDKACRVKTVYALYIKSIGACNPKTKFESLKISGSQELARTRYNLPCVEKVKIFKQILDYINV